MRTSTVIKLLVHTVEKILLLYSILSESYSIALLVMTAILIAAEIFADLID